MRGAEAPSDAQATDQPLIKGLHHLRPHCAHLPLQAKSAGQVTCQLSCMSRAGREPGYKKQNQDNCFAFEKYVAAGQSLFGAFDGHGPNGGPASS